MTFIVRVQVDASGRMAGVLERARTGEKQTFDDVTVVGALIARMVAAEEKTEKADYLET